MPHPPFASRRPPQPLWVFQESPDVPPTPLPGHHRQQRPRPEEYENVFFGWREGGAPEGSRRGGAPPSESCFPYARLTRFRTGLPTDQRGCGTRAILSATQFGNPPAPSWGLPTCCETSWQRAFPISPTLPKAAPNPNHYLPSPLPAPGIPPPAVTKIRRKMRVSGFRPPDNLVKIQVSQLRSPKNIVKT